MYRVAIRMRDKKNDKRCPKAGLFCLVVVVVVLNPSSDPHRRVRSSFMTSQTFVDENNHFTVRTTITRRRLGDWKNPAIAKWVPVYS